MARRAMRLSARKVIRERPAKVAHKERRANAERALKASPGSMGRKAFKDAPAATAREKVAG